MEVESSEHPAPAQTEQKPEAASDAPITVPTDTPAVSSDSNANGNIEQAEPTQTEPSHPDPQPSTDIEMKDASEIKDPEAETEETPGTAAAPVAVPNGTPSQNKRVSTGGSAKKRSSGVPEHRQKKLNKKKSRPLTNLDAKPGDYFLARMKGHPPWPSIICDEEMLPSNLLNSRPVTAALPDGSFKRAEYADGGKRVSERTFPIMFLFTNEFAWIPNTDLTPLDPTSDDVKNPTEKSKSKTLLAAYATASEANDLSTFKTMLAEHQKAVEEDMALRLEREAEKAAKAERRKAGKKSEKAEADEGDSMDMDDDEEGGKPKSKKRKKTEDDGDADEKPSKTPKTTTKLKLSTPKQPSEPGPKKKSSAAGGKAKKAKNGSDEDAGTPKVEEKPLSPAALKEIKEKKVLYFRHKLQRGFLSRDTVPKADEMRSMSDFLTELETFPDLEGSIIRATKIHKVLKQMIKLDAIPLEEEFKFKQRSAKLLELWNHTLSSEAPASATPAGDDAPKPAAEEGDTAKPAEASAPTEKAEEPKPTPDTQEAKIEEKTTQPATINGNGDVPSESKPEPAAESAAAEPEEHKEDEKKETEAMEA